MKLQKYALFLFRNMPLSWIVRLSMKMTAELDFYRYEHKTKYWISIYHPIPEYDLHILLLPRNAYKDLTDLKNEDPASIQDLLIHIESLIDKYQLNESNYRIILNGGTNQLIKMIHFHLVSEISMK